MAYGTCGGISRAGLAFVVALHALVFMALLQADVVRLPQMPSMLTVDLIRPPEAAPRPPATTEPPRPQPVERRPTPQPIAQPAPLAAPEAPPVPPTVAVPSAPTIVRSGHQL
ncbi:MAG: hypothetical protein ACK4Q4_08680 [Rhodocyclaceae bacterium]